MERKVKYDYAFKEGCVKLVLEEHRSYGFVSKLKGADKSNIRKWVGFYKKFGDLGLLPRINQSYSSDFKLVVLVDINKSFLSLREACLKFNIPDAAIIVKWKRDFANFFSYSLKSANETIYWLGLLKDARKVDGPEMRFLIDETEQILDYMGLFMESNIGKAMVSGAFWTTR